MLDLIRNGNTPLIAAHRGLSGGNIPCNSEAAYLAALNQGADIVEIDVSVTLDKKLYAFHPFKEHAHLNLPLPLRFMFSGQVGMRSFVNQDNVKTNEKILTFDDALELLKGKCVVNIDKFWTAPKQITECIRRHNMQNQVIIKTHPSEKMFRIVESIAPDMMFMVIAKKDDFSKELLTRKLNFVGIEALFKDESSPLIAPEYIDYLHNHGLAIWGNAIVYDRKEIISAGHTDDIALTKDADYGWGWFKQNKFDIVQTDFLTQMKNYFASAE